MTKMKFIAISFFILFSTNAKAQLSNERLLEAQKERFTAMIGKDSSFLAANIDQRLVYIHSNGLVQDKKDFIQSIMKGTLVYQSIETKDRQIRKYKNTAIINGIVHVKGILNGSFFEIDLRYTDIMINSKGWKLASWQSLKL